MKKISLTIIQLFCFNLFAQQQLILPSTNSQTNSTIIQEFLKRSYIGKYEFVKLNKDAFKNELIEANLFGKNSILKGNFREIRSENDFTWEGFDENIEKHLYTVSGNNILGFYVRNNKIYRTETIDNQQINYEVNQEKFPQESCHLLAKPLEKTQTNNATIATLPCKVRVLVLYTSDAANPSAGGVADIKNHIQNAIDISNLSYQNSNIPTRLELAFAGATSYIETASNMSLALNDFTFNNDGKMDEVFQLRTQYSADLCVLMGKFSGSCGIAWLGGSYTYGFSVNEVTCAVSNLTFPHELGHNFGAMHDPYVETGGTYEHGYVNLANKWRTIMAYDNQCTASGFNCTRLPYFSNPTINYGGVPMGTITSHDNTRKHTERNNTVMMFNQPSLTLNLSSTDASGFWGIGIAKNTISNTSNFVVNSANKYTFNANSILLQPGFQAQNGSIFVALPSIISDCGLTTQPIIQSK